MTANRKTIAQPAPLADEDDEVRELAAEDSARMRPVWDFPDLVEVLQKNGALGRRPLPPGEKKQRVTLHLDPDVLAAPRKDGRGWQIRANSALRRALGL